MTGAVRDVRGGVRDGYTPDRRLVLATDLDGTMAGGSPESRSELTDLLSRHREATLIYVTGRTPGSAKGLLARASLPDPDVLIADVGTSVLAGAGPDRLEEIEAEMEWRWPGSAAVRERLEGIDGLRPQDVEAPRRLSYWIEPVRRRRSGVQAAGAGGEEDPFEARPPGDVSLDAASAAVAAEVARTARAALEGLDLDVLVSGNVFLDVLPRGVNKGTTLERVLNWLGVDPSDCVVAGDSLNDVALFRTQLRGIVVGNCEPALRRLTRDMEHVYQAGAEGAAGVLEGLRHYGHLRTRKVREVEEAMSSSFIVLSHREPYSEVEGPDGETTLLRKTNGVFTTLDSVMRKKRGTWIAWRERSPGEAFEERIRVPSAEHEESYSVRRIPLDPEEARRFYYDFTSTALWPVLFSLLDRARFTAEAWEAYQRVNRAFADATCEEAAPNALVWVNDFHLMLAPKLMKQRRPDLRLALFLHTTFPRPTCSGCSRGGSSSWTGCCTWT